MGDSSVDSDFLGDTCACCARIDDIKVQVPFDSDAMFIFFGFFEGRSKLGVLCSRSVFSTSNVGIPRLVRDMAVARRTKGVTCDLLRHFWLHIGRDTSSFGLFEVTRTTDVRIPTNPSHCPVANVAVAYCRYTRCCCQVLFRDQVRVECALVRANPSAWLTYKDIVSKATGIIIAVACGKDLRTNSDHGGRKKGSDETAIYIYMPALSVLLSCLEVATPQLSLSWITFPLASRLCMNCFSCENYSSREIVMSGSAKKKERLEMLNWLIDATCDRVWYCEGNRGDDLSLEMRLV